MKRTQPRAQTEPAPAPAPPKAEMTFWLTRDRDVDGKLSAIVDVWLTRPSLKRILDTQGFYWTAPVESVETGEGPKLAKYQVWNLEQCIAKCRTYPDDHRQCIRVGHEPTESPCVS